MSDEDLVEALARAAHEAYRDHLARNPPSGATPADVPWQELSDVDKAQNYDQARLNILWVGQRGMEILPSPEVPEHQRIAEIPAHWVTELAIEEHARWYNRRWAQGYRWGDVRSDVDPEKRHPDVVAWEDLSEEAQEKDREPIRQVPSLLARCGYALVWKDRHMRRSDILDRSLSELGGQIESYYLRGDFGPLVNASSSALPSLEGASQTQGWIAGEIARRTMAAAAALSRSDVDVWRSRAIAFHSLGGCRNGIALVILGSALSQLPDRANALAILRAMPLVIDESDQRIPPNRVKAAYEEACAEVLMLGQPDPDPVSTASAAHHIHNAIRLSSGDQRRSLRLQATLVTIDHIRGEPTNQAIPRLEAVEAALRALGDDASAIAERVRHYLAQLREGPGSYGLYETFGSRPQAPSPMSS